MILHKAGECLSYGLGHEFIKRSSENNNNQHLKAFIVYFALRGFLDTCTAQKLKMTVTKDYDSTAWQDKCFEDLAKLIIHDLRKHFSFENFESLCRILNEIKIPHWIFEAADSLLEVYPQIYMVHDFIYYMVDEDDRYYFRCIHAKKANKMMQYSHDFSEDFDTDMNGCDETNRTISNKYSEILGFNEDTRTFYLRFNHVNSMYVEFHADTNQEIVHHHRCFGVLGNKFPVIEDGNNLSLVIGDEIKRIKEIDPLEQYSVVDNVIRVEPAWGKPTVTKPYVIRPDGNRDEISHSEEICYFLKRMRDDICSFHSLLLWEEEEEINKNRDKDVTVFSLDYLDRFLREKHNLEENREARIYYFVVKLLKAYLPSDEDVLDYFFLLADVSNRIKKEYDMHFISESIYWRLNELHLSGKLKNVINNLDKFRNKLLEDAYWDDETIREKCDERRYLGRVGYFEMKKNKLMAHTEEIDNAICVGSQLIARWEDLPGIVSYNLEIGTYEIQYNRELSSAEIHLVLAEYHILDVAYRVFVDRRNEV